MNKQLTINNIFEIDRVLEDLLFQHTKMPIPLALKLSKIKRETSEIVSYVSGRVVEAIPKINTDEHIALTDDEQRVYETIMNSLIDFDNQGLCEEDFSNASEVSADVETALKILCLL